MLYSQHYLSFKCQEKCSSYTFKQGLAINHIDICLAMDASEDQVCVICKKPIELLPKVTLGEKGSATINRVSKERNETLQSRKASNFNIVSGTLPPWTLICIIN